MRISNRAHRENFPPEFMPHPPSRHATQKLSPANQKVKNPKTTFFVNIGFMYHPSINRVGLSVFFPRF